jgi:hypothetical protein
MERRNNMPSTTKTRSGRTLIRPRPKEEAAIQQGIDQGPDNPEWTAGDFKKARRLGEVNSDNALDLEPALQKFHELALAEGDLGYAYWYAIGQILRGAATMQASLDAAGEELEQCLAHLPRGARARYKMRSDDQIDLVIALRKIHELAVAGGDLGQAYWSEVGQLLQRAATMQEQRKALGRELEWCRAQITRPVKVRKGRASPFGG